MEQTSYHLWSYFCLFGIQVIMQEYKQQLFYRIASTFPIIADYGFTYNLLPIESFQIISGIERSSHRTTLHKRNARINTPEPEEQFSIFNNTSSGTITESESSTHNAHTLHRILYTPK